jgi:hypothetical protein
MTDAPQRWQKIQIDQFGYALNLFLTFAVAALGYWFALLKDDSFDLAGSAEFWFLMSFFMLLIAIFGGGYCVLNRLADFRGTAQRAR